MSKNPLAILVEDDVELIDIFAKALEMAEYEIQIVDDGQIALERLAETQPALVVLDLHLPNVSGEKILKQIRSSPQLAKTRVVLATADPRFAEMLRPEADLVLIKPISFIQLRDLTARLRPPDTMLDE